MATKKQPQIAAVDLDGTILEYSGWKGPAHFGKPLPGIVQELSKLKQAGWAIVIWTCRATDHALRSHLEKHGIPYDYINKHPWQPEGSSHKMFANIYIDDRALRVNGNSKGLASRVLDKKKSWTEKKASSIPTSYDSGHNHTANIDAAGHGITTQNKQHAHEVQRHEVLGKNHDHDILKTPVDESERRFRMSQQVLGANQAGGETIYMKTKPYAK